MRKTLVPFRDHLMQVGGLDKRPQARGDIGGRCRIRWSRHFQGGAELHAADAYAGRFEASERHVRVFEFNGEMTAIETDADVLADGVTRRGHADAKPGRQPFRAVLEQPAFEELDRLGGVFEQAVRFRFDVQMQHLAALTADAHERFGDPRDVRGDRCPILLAGVGHPRLVRQRRRGDAAVHVVRHEPPKDLDEVQGVLHPRLVAPVRRIDVRLYRRAVKGAVGKAIDDGDVEALAVEKRPEAGETVALQELTRLHS